MNILEKLSERWKGVDYPFLIHSNRPLKFDEVINQQHIDLSGVEVVMSLRLLVILTPVNPYFCS